MNRKEQLHAIGNYLQDRFDYKWSFADEADSFPITIVIEPINVFVTYDFKRQEFLVYTKQGDGKVGRYFQTPLACISHILTKKGKN